VAVGVSDGWTDFMQLLLMLQLHEANCCRVGGRAARLALYAPRIRAAAEPCCPVRLQVELILRLMGMTHTRNTLVGNALTRQVARRGVVLFHSRAQRAAPLCTAAWLQGHGHSRSTCTAYPA
jgi:hypothetical protein